MKDRSVEYPGRFKLTDATSGDEYIYDIERAEGNVAEAGTPFNVANVLADATATALGLTDAATPNDAYAAIAARLDAADQGVDDALNNEAAEFDSATAYTTGNYVVYEGDLYKFTADHAAGDWTGSDATQVTIGAELVSIKGTVDSLDAEDVAYDDAETYTAGTVGAEVTAIKEDISEIPTGTYPDMTVGGLLGGDITSQVPYTSRSSGGEVDAYKLEYLDAVVGGSIAWNQLIQNGDFANGNTGWLTISSTYGGSTYDSANNTATYTASDDSGSYGFLYGIMQNDVKFDIPTSHKVLVSAKVNASTSVIFRLYLMTGDTGFSNTYAIRRQATAGSWVNMSGILTGNDSDTFKRIKICYSAVPSVNDSFSVANIQAFDLTQMFGSTIADQAYAMEQNEEGTGIAWLQTSGFFTEDYYAYNTGELMSVQTSAHVTKDANDTVLGTYALDSSLTLRGIPKLDASNNLYYDGDEYGYDGSVTRRYGIVDLGTKNWEYVGNYGSSTNVFRTYTGHPVTPYDKNANAICSKYITVSYNVLYGGADKCISISRTSAPSDLYGTILISDTTYSDAATFKTAMSGVYLVYELATPTTETADAYTQTQPVDANGTEEFTDSRTIPVPVGNVTRYPQDLTNKIIGLPYDLSMIAPVEETTTASQNYAVDSFLIYDNTLYKVTVAIAQGGTITVGTNVTATTVMAQIMALA